MGGVVAAGAACCAPTEHEMARRRLPENRFTTPGAAFGPRAILAVSLYLGGVVAAGAACYAPTEHEMASWRLAKNRFTTPELPSKPKAWGEP